MSLLKEAKQGLQEVVNKEVKLGVKEYLMALGGGLLISVGAYLYGSHAVEFGRRAGRAEILGKLSDTAEKLDSINESINKN